MGGNQRGGLSIPSREASILDVAPTLLAMLGLPAARDMPGRILDEALDEGLLRRVPERVDSYGGVDLAVEGPSDEDLDEGFKERLRALGYLR